MNKEIKGIRIAEGVSIGDCKSYYIDVHYGFDNNGRAKFTNYMVTLFSNGAVKYHKYGNHCLKARFNKRGDKAYIYMEGQKMSICDFMSVEHQSKNEVVKLLLGNLDKVVTI